MTLRADGTEDLVSNGTALDGGQTALSSEDKDVLVSKISGSSFFDEGVDDDVAPAKKVVDDDARAEDDDVQDDDVQDDDVQAASGDDAGEAVEDKDTDDQAASGDDADPTPGSVVPGAYRRSLKAMGWNDGEIDSFSKADPDSSMKTFERIHASRVAQMQEFSRLGRERINAQQGVADSGTATEANRTKVSGAIPRIDVAALVGEYGEENAELFGKIVAPINAAVERLNEVLPMIDRGIETAAEAEMESKRKLISDFFASDDLKPYADFYGDPTKGRTPDEQARYVRVLQEADAMIVGASYQGRTLHPTEAMEMAHAVISADHTVKAVRGKLKAAVKKRGASVSLKPAAGGKGGSGRKGPAKNKVEALENAKQGLAAVFGRWSA